MTVSPPSAPGGGFDGGGPPLLSSGSAGPPGRRPAGPAGTAPDGGAGRRPGNPAPAGPPAPARPSDGRLLGLASAYAALFLEVEAGRRPRRHLEPVMNPRLAARLAPVWVRGGPPGSVLRVSGCRTEAGHFDAVAVVRRCRRVGALCLRLVWTPAGWRVQEAARPEDGILPDPPVPVPLDEPDSFDLVLG